MTKTNIAAAWVKCNRFQRAEDFVGIAGESYRELYPPEEWAIY